MLQTRPIENPWVNLAQTAQMKEFASPLAQEEYVKLLIAAIRLAATATHRK
jgi:hypothetical protein